MFEYWFREKCEKILSVKNFIISDEGVRISYHHRSGLK